VTPGPEPDELHALRAERAQLRMLCNNVPVAMAYFEHPGDICRYANQGYAAMFGHTETSILGLTVPQIIGEEAAALIRPKVDQVLQERRGTSYERQLSDAQGTQRDVEVHLLPHCAASGEAIGAYVLISDITRHRRADAALRESEERLAKFMHASVEGIVFHKGGFVTDVNPPLLELGGYTLPEMLGRSTLDFVAPDQRDRVKSVMASGAETTYDSALLHRDGQRIPVEFIVRTLHYQGETLRMTIVRDIRDRLEAQARIHHLAHHDALTGLPNRACFHRTRRVVDGPGGHCRAGRWRCCSSTWTTSSASTIRWATRWVMCLLQTVAERIIARGARIGPGRTFWWRRVCAAAGRCRKPGLR
jgi:PAS domain S-box-containing protein